MRKERTKIRYILATFFILCGLIIGILGTYGCMTYKYYKGVLPLTDSRVPNLEANYPNDVARVGSTLSYDIVETKKIEGMPYTSESNFAILYLVSGLAFLGLGISIIFKEDLLFSEKKVG